MTCGVMSASPARSQPQPGFVEFVVLIASMMAMGALGIDAMLPALPAIGHDLHVQVENHQQWIVAFYFAGMGVGQLAMGVLSDWLGRKRVLLTGIVLYVILGLIAAVVNNFALLIFIRLIQGCSASTSTVVTRSIVRDLYVGPRMAQVMSMSYVVFLLVPIAAPSLGQVILLFAPWRAIFAFMSLFGAVVGLWAWLRLPETHTADKRRRPDTAHLKRVAYFVSTEPSSLVYTLGIAVLVGALLAYVSLMPQMFRDVFHSPGMMAPVFAICAGTMAVASMINATLVERIGLKRISHSALTAFIAVTVIHLLWAATGHETLVSFVILQSLTMGFQSLTTSNFSAIAMEKVGHVAGTAASLQGFTTTVGGAIISAMIGQGWTGHIMLLPLGACICGVIAYGLVFLGEKGRMYRNSAPADASQVFQVHD